MSSELAKEILDIEAQLAVDQGSDTVEIAAEDWNRLVALARGKVCGRCNGEGKIANSKDGEPWSAWANLPPGADLAVKMGVVKPIPCPDCSPRSEDRS